MAQYIDQIAGYIADNPNQDFERCDGKVFSYYEVNTANMSATNNTLSINGGQGNYPLAFIETDKAQEFTFASSQFSLDMFAMANAVQMKQGDVATLESKLYEVKAGLKVTIPYETQAESVKINGFEQADTAAAGKFAVASGDGDTPTTEITFHEGDIAVGDTIRIAYRRRVNGASMATVKTNSTTAKGALYAHWPVYSSGTDCTESSIKGYLHLFIPRVRVTALPGFDNSYKSAATNSVTFSAIDPKRADEKMYDLYYEPLDANGAVVTTPTGEVTWN